MATTSGPLTGTINGTNTVFSLGAPCASILIVFADSVPVYAGSGAGFFTVTDFTTGTISLGTAPVDPDFAPYAIYNDLAPAPPAPTPTVSISGPCVIDGNIYYPMGTTALVTLAFNNTASDGTVTPINLTGSEVLWGVKTSSQESYPSVLAKHTPSSGVVLTSPTNGVATVTISPGDMLTDYPGAYEFSSEAVLIDGTVVPGASGRFFLRGRSVVPA